MTLAHTFAGLTAAPFTPFRPDGELNLDRVADQAGLLEESGVRGAFVNGTTGEGPSLTTDERKELAERWVREAGGRLRVIVHSGHASVAEARELTRHAASIGADAVAVTAPYYFRPGVADLVGFLADVAAAAPRLPFYFYDIPSTTGVLLPTAEVLRRAADRIPNLAGVKFSNPDLLSLQECVNLDGGRFEVMFGVDEYLLAAVALGATGAVGSTYNYAAPVYHRMLAALSKGDLEAARRDQSESAKLVRALIDFGGVRAGKAVMGMLGVDCGPVRPPLRPMTRDESAGLYERLKDLPIFPRPLRKPG
jgi:N-acetylneuraminate lyase